MNNLQAFHAAIEAVCPIVGVDGTGHIWFDPAATPSQIAAAQAAAVSYVDVPAQIVPVNVILARMTDAEYTAFFAFASAHPNLHRVIFQIGQIDVSLPAAAALQAALVAALVLATASRAAAVFAPLPPPTPPPPAAPAISAQSIYTPFAAPAI